MIAAAKDGDGDAYGELVRRYQNLACRVAFLITGDAAEAEDAAQNAFLKAWTALPRFQPGHPRPGMLNLRSSRDSKSGDGSDRRSPFRPWLLAIVANEARNRRAAARRHPTLTLSAVEERSAGDTVLTPEATALAAEQRQSLLNAVNTLRDDDRLVIGCRYFLELSEAETSDALGVARGTVKSRLSRALGRLHDRLIAQEVDGEVSHD